jgi:tetratricopeptide (TPR) repeat protein
MANGVAGRTDYSSWDKRAKELSRQVEELDNEETNVNAKALGLDGKYAASSAEADERIKAKELKKKSTALEGFKKREDGVAEVLAGLLGPFVTDGPPVVVAIENGQTVVKHITRELLSAGKRVLRIADTTGPGKIILTSDLSNLQSEMPSNGLQPKSYKDDAESYPEEEIVEGRMVPQDKAAVVRGLIKLVLCNLHSCTVIIRCKIITGTVEISHCTNLTVIVDGDDATVITIQADICTNLDIQFHDSPSGKNIPQPQLKQATTVFWGQDTEDRVYHAGVSKLHISTYRDTYLEYETPNLDYIELGATAIGNSKPEEVQFVTSIINGEFITERILSITEKIQAGGGGNGAKPMTERELRTLEEKRGKIHTALDGYMKDVIRITDKDGKEVVVPSKSDHDRPVTATNEDGNNNNNDDDDVVEEVYASKTREEIDAIIECSNCEKIKGNESFMAGEYAQAILFYTLALERATELPDAFDITEMLGANVGVVGSAKSSSSSKFSVVEQLFPRHVVLSNRSACFLKLGHHDKALKDGRDAEILDPTYVKGIFRKGLALHAMGRYDEAIVSLAAALKIEPKNKQIKQALGFAEMRMTQEMRKRMQG